MNICSPLDCLSEVLDNVPDMAFAFNRNECYLYVNLAGARMLRYDASDLIGQHWRDLGLPSDVMEPLLTRVHECFDSCCSGKMVLQGSPEFGSHVWDISLTPMMCDREDVVCVLALAHDITQYVEPQR